MEQDDRERQSEPDVQGNLETQREGLERTIEDELPVGEVLEVGPRRIEQPINDLIESEPSGHAGDRHRSHDPDQPSTELLEMLEERHAAVRVPRMSAETPAGRSALGTAPPPRHD